MTNAYLNTEVLYEALDFPIFQNRMYDTPEEARACPKGNICLIQNPETGIVYNRLFRPDLMRYDPRYQIEQAVSPFFQQHLESVARIIDQTIGRRSIVEVGCGKGYFLEMLISKGFKVTGFDPSYEGDSPHVIKEYFNPGVKVQADGIVLRHVLEHIQDPFQFLLSLRNANGGSGLIYIEVPCFDWIKQHRAWFDIFYEHVNYFRLSDFKRMFTSLVRCGHLFGGQYHYLVADLTSLSAPKFDPLDQVHLTSDFMGNLLSSKQQAATSPGVTAIWGGASKGVIFALLRERIGRAVDLVIDVNPAKQGKFLPGTGLEVKSPSEAVSLLPSGATIFVMNSNYLQEIQQMSNNAYQYVGIEQDVF